MFTIIYGLLNIIDKSVNQPFYSIQKERRYKWGRLLFSDWHKLLIQAADTLSLILQNICELGYPLNPVLNEGKREYDFGHFFYQSMTF